MCRWFAYISSTEPCLLEDVLITPQHSITKQVHEHYLPGLFTSSPTSALHTTKKEIALRNRLFNSDGLGVSWYSTTRSEFLSYSSSPSSASSSSDSTNISLPALYRTTQPPNNDTNFKSLCGNISSKCVFAHIRMATSVVTQFNNHPFIFGRMCFMHNGYIDDFTSIKNKICDIMHPDAYKNVLGTTDSEHLAGLYMTYLSPNGSDGWNSNYTLQQMKEALDKTVQTVQDIQSSFEGVKFGPNDLNLCVTDGEQLVAFRWRSHVDEQPPSLYYSETAGVTLNRKFPGHPDADKEHRGKMDAEEHGRHVIVSSEPTTSQPAEWHLIGKNEAVMVDGDSRVWREKINATF